LKIYINKSVKIVCIISKTSYPIAFKIFAFCCILIDGSDYYYYTDVTPLKFCPAQVYWFCFG